MNDTEKMLKKLEAFPVQDGKVEVEEIFFVATFTEPIPVDEFRKIFYYKSDYFDTNDVIVPCAVIANVSKMENVQVTSYDTKVKKIVSYPHIPEYLDEVNVKEIRFMLSTFVEDPAVIENYKGLKKDEVIQKLLDLFQEVNPKGAKLDFIGSCNSNAEKECITKNCSKCPITTEILKKVKV